MTQSTQGRANSTADAPVLIAVRDEGEAERIQGTLINGVDKAERIVNALIESGVPPNEVKALRAREIPLRVTCRWLVELIDTGEPAPELPDTEESPREISQAGPPTAAREHGRPTKSRHLLEEIAPERPFQLRVDRAVWFGLWTASLLVLALSLLTSLSGGAAREFVVGTPLPVEEESGQTEPGLTPETPALSPTVAAAARVPSCIEGGINECRCNDFATHAEAQAFFEEHPPGPGHNVDPDGDGVVCEYLPGSPAWQEP